MSKLRNWRYKLLFNFFPCYRRTGARVDAVSIEDRLVNVRLPLNWKTRGYFGVIFGGSIYGAADPVYMAMLNTLLGPEYVAWDKRATVHFKRPANTTLYATFSISQEELESIRNTLETEISVDRTYPVVFTGNDGAVYATLEKVVNIRKRRAQISTSQDA